MAALNKISVASPSVSQSIPLYTNGMRVGLLGGSFNPPHAAHRAISLFAIKRLKLDRVWWLVTPGNPLKDNGALHELEERAQAVMILQRIARRHQPPHPIELQPLQREQADGAMRGMRRIERAAKQPDAHAVAVERDHRTSGRRRNWLQLDDPGERITAGSARCRGRDI